MIIGSNKIGGVEVIQYTCVSEFEIGSDSGDRIGTMRFKLIGPPLGLLSYSTGTEFANGIFSEFGFGGVAGARILEPGLEVEISQGDISGSLFGSKLFGEAVFGGSGSVERVFFGKLTRVATKAITFGESGYTEYTCEARDYSFLLDTAVISDAVSFEDAPDSDIVTAIAAYQPELTVEASTAEVLDDIAFENISLRQALEQIVELTGATFKVDANKVLRYRPATEAAPFSISETPNYLDSFPAEAQEFQFDQDFSNITNRIEVLGKLGAGGVAISATVDDAESQALYGMSTRVIVDRNIQTVEQATARANVELATFAYPVKQGSFNIRREGLAVGQLISINSPAIGVNEAFVIRKLSMTWTTPTETLYTVEFGGYKPDLARLIRKLRDASKQPAYPPVAIPPPLTVNASHLASTLEAPRVVNSFPPLPDPNYTDTALIFLTTDRKIYRRDGNDWTAEVEAVDLSGQITETQIEDDAISTPKLQALAITANKIAAGAVTAGKLAADSVIAGTIAAGAIRAIDAAFDFAAIQNADIASLSATKLTAGTIDAAIIAVANLNATNITVGTLNVARIADASITSAKIASLVADKITAGTISAVTINSATINGGAISGTSLALSLNGITTTIANNSSPGGLGFAGLLIKLTSGAEQISMSYGAIVGLNSGGTVSMLTVAGSGSIGGFAPGFYAYSSFPFTGVTLNASAGLVTGALPANCGSYQVGAVTVINSSRQFVGSGGVSVAAAVSGTSLQVSGSTVVSAANQFVGSGGVFVSASISGTSILVSGSTSINSFNQFVGNGANCPAGIAATGFNIFGGALFGQSVTCKVYDGTDVGGLRCYTITFTGGIVTAKSGPQAAG